LTIDTVDIVQIEYCVIINQLLLDILKFHDVAARELKRPVSILTTPLGPASVLRGVDGFHSDHNREVVFLENLQIVFIVQIRVDYACLRGKLLFDSRRKLERKRLRVVWVRVKIKRVLLRISEFLCTNIDRDFTLVIAVKFES
jgi:hypothetical protein